MSGLFKPKIEKQTSGAAPLAPRIEAPNRELGDEGDRKDTRKRKGRNSLRIDPQTGGVNSKGGAGINVPMK